MEHERSLDDFLGFIRSTAVFQKLELDKGTQQAELSIASLRDRCSKPSQYDIVMSELCSVTVKGPEPLLEIGCLIYTWATLLSEYNTT